MKSLINKSISGIEFDTSYCTIQLSCTNNSMACFTKGNIIFIIIIPWFNTTFIFMMMNMQGFILVIAVLARELVTV